MSKQHLFRYLDENGDGTGNDNAAVDGSVTPVVFKIQTNADDSFRRSAHIHRMIIHVDDNGQFKADEYGALGVKLANGIRVELRNVADDSVIVDYTNGLPIDSNAEWSRLCYDVIVLDFGTPANQTLAVRWTFDKSGIPLALTPNEYLAVIISDDLTDLNHHYFHVQGHYLPI